MSNLKLGEVYFRDQYGNFHKLSTKDFNEELNELSNFDNIIVSKNFKEYNCKYKPYFCNLLLLDGDCHNVDNNKIKLDKGLYRFTVYLNLETCHNQTIYFFMRNHNVISDTLKVKEVNDKIPNNISFNFVLPIECPENFEVVVLSEKKLSCLKSYLMFVKLN